MKVYADHAATTRLDMDAFEAMKPYLLDEYANASQPYSFSRSAKAALKSARATIAKCINADPDEIYFTSGGTESDNWAIKGSALIHNDYRQIITSQIEHHAVLNACESIESLGHPVTYLPVDRTGTILPSSLEAVIDSSTKLVSIMLANNEIGSIQQIRELCSIAHKYNAYFHTDAVQAIGHIPVDVKWLGIDCLSASAHKFNGPKGVGFLYIRNGVSLARYADGGAQEMGLRAGTENIASIVGMATALEKNILRMKASMTHLNHLEELLITRLITEKIAFSRNGGQNKLPGNISLSFPGVSGELMLHRLDLMGICVSTGSACDSQNTQVSHVLKAIGIPEQYARGTIRISLGHENTEADVDVIARAIIKIVKP